MACQYSSTIQTMKHLYLIIALALVAATANAQSFFITTAKQTGNWSDMNNWDYSIRQDGKKLTTVVIPAQITITLDEAADLESLGTVEMIIRGTLQLRSNQSIELEKNSTVSVEKGGLIKQHPNAKNGNKKKVEQIKIGNVIKYNGDVDGTIAGPASASSTTGASPLGFSSSAMLPVNFVSFNASKTSETVIGLTWTTTDEVNNSHFEIQRSIDGTNFKSIAIVLPDVDNNNIHMYRYNDKYSTQGVVYYRIRQVDIDGKDKFSPVRVINGSKAGADATIYVAGNKSVVVDLKSNNSNVIVRLVSMSGVVIAQRSNANGTEKITINANTAAAGAYVVQVSDMKGLALSKKILL